MNYLHCVTILHPLHRIYTLTHNFVPQLQDHLFEIFPDKKHIYHGPGSQGLRIYHCMNV